MRIQHNITAMSAYRNYTNNASALAKNLEKLSSGYKINRAGDDAAGLAISEKMRAQITGLEVAQKNAKDGISLVQTAEGALTEVHSMLNRMYELAEQSANGTYADEVDREQLQKEISTLSKEIDRISESANFNGIKLLDGSLSSGSTGSGGGIETDGTLADVTVTHVLDGQDALPEKLASFKVDLSQLELTNGVSNASTALAASTIKVGGQNMLKSVASVKIEGDGTAKLTDLITSANVVSSVTIDGSKYDVTYADGVLTFTQQEGQGAELNANAITVAVGSVGTGGTNNHGYTQSVELIEQGQTAGEKMYAQASFNLTKVADGYQLKIGDSTYTFAVGSESKFKGGANVVDLTDIASDDADLQKIAAERLSKAAAGNKNFHVTSDTNSATVHLTEKPGGVDYKKNDLSGGDNDGTNASATATDWKGLVQEGKAKAPGADDAAAGTKKAAALTLQIGDTAEEFNKMTVDVAACDADSIGIGDIDISTQTGASDAMAKIKNAINYVSDVRGGLGATQNRLEHTINNLSVMQENIQDAESTIRDVDVAKEMMDYTKNSILVQSAQAMLAQANQLPQGVLQLLQ